MLPALFFISFVTIGWQLGLMRCLLMARYHHFSFLVISCALLGFGAGGTVLSLGRTWFVRNYYEAYRWGILLFAVSLPVCFWLGEALPLQVYFPPVNFLPTLGWWVLFWLIHTVPFLLAGMLVGLALMIASGRAHRAYAANLTGSAAGAIGGIWLLDLVPPNGIVLWLGLFLVLSAAFLVDASNRRSRWAYGSCVALLGLLFVGAQGFHADKLFPLNIDQYKTLAYIDRLMAQGDAKRIAVYNSARGSVELFSGPHFHALMSLSGAEPPPPMDIVIRDGFHAGSIPVISQDEQARFLRGTLTALPYKLIQPESVLVLGESGSTYLWLARLSPAKSIVFVQPDRNIIRILEDHPSRPLTDPRIKVIVAEPRAFLDRTSEAFDIIHLAALEGFAAGSGGIGGLREDYLATVEGFTRCLDALSPHGIAGVVRGIQDPPRDNIKIAATWIEALEKRGSRRPGDHMLIARDELNVATFVSPSRLGASEVKAFREACHTMSWDMDWFPGVRPDLTNRVHNLPGPPGAAVSWYFHAMGKLLSGERSRFYREWIANVRPATDNMPFFYDFFRWVSLSRLREVFGPLWPTRAEMGFLVLLVAVIWTAATAALLLPPAVILLRRASGSPSLRLICPTVGYFAAIGTGFMFLEMTLIQLFTRFLGNPVVAAALVIGSLLFCAGLGSLVQPKVTGPLRTGILAVTAAIALLVTAETWLLPAMFETVAGLGDVWKAAISLGMIAPLAVLMGMPFPWALARLAQEAEAAIPLAWAVNGFASVVSASGAVVLAMVYGFNILLALAAGVYCIAGVLGLALLGGQKT